MPASLTSTVRAGRLLQLLGWISLALLLLVLGFFPPAPDLTWRASVRFTPFELLIGFLNYAVLCLVTGAAIRRYKPWAKVLGVGLSVISLPYFPFGTLLGVGTLAYLYRGWHELPEI
jgi:hypothetical protein